MPTHAFTVRKLADTAGVGVEAVRFYQRRGLMREPQREGNGFRQYSQEDVRRLQFIKRAQDLGFSLDDVATLVSLSADTDQDRVREIAQQRIVDIRQRAAQLSAMASALEGMVSCCQRSSPHEACPIIAALVDQGTPSTDKVAA